MASPTVAAILWPACYRVSPAPGGASAGFSSSGCDCSSFFWSRPRGCFVRLMNLLPPTQRQSAHDLTMYNNPSTTISTPTTSVLHAVKLTEELQQRITISKQTHLVGERFMLKSHQNTTNYSHCVDVSVSISMFLV